MLSIKYFFALYSQIKFNEWSEMIISAYKSQWSVSSFKLGRIALVFLTP